MENLKCEKCGYEMSSQSDVCPNCEFDSDQTTCGDEMEIFDELSGDWIVPKKSETQVMDLVEKYNSKAREWGYDVLEYNSDTKILKGAFVAKDEAKGIIERTKEKYRNGYMEEDFDKIVKLCDVKWND